MNEEQIKLLIESRDLALMQIQTMQEAELDLKTKISKLENNLAYTKKNNLGLTVSATSLELLLQNQIEFQKSILEKFLIEKQEREKMYREQVAIADKLLKIMQ